MSRAVTSCEPVWREYEVKLATAVVVTVANRPHQLIETIIKKLLGFHIAAWR